MRDASSGALERLRTLSRSRLTKVLTWRGSENCIPSCRLIELAAPNAGESSKRISRTREKESIEERSKISPYVALLSETDNILWYIPIEGRISSWFLLHTHTHIHTFCLLSIFLFFDDFFRCSLCQFTTFFFRNASTTIHTRFYSSKLDAFSGSSVSDCSRFKTVLQ